LPLTHLVDLAQFPGHAEGGMLRFLRFKPRLIFLSPQNAPDRAEVGMSFSTATSTALTKKSLRVSPWRAAHALALLTTSSGRSLRFTVFVVDMVLFVSYDTYVVKQKTRLTHSRYAGNKVGLAGIE
jgi:hypothetical protein